MLKNLQMSEIFINFVRFLKRLIGSNSQQSNKHI